MRILAVAPSNHMETFEAGNVGRAIEASGGELVWAIRRLGHGVPASHEPYDGLLVFGGEMSVTDAAVSDYVSAVAGLVRDFHHTEKPVLGICLGSQIIAHAFGGAVRAMGTFECGFTELEHTEHAADDALIGDAPSTISLFEMHEDTFDLPEGAVHLLSGQAVRNQAFRMGVSTYAFQCHFEVVPEIVAAWNSRVQARNPDFFERLGPPNPLERQPADFEALQPGQEAFAAHATGRWMALVAARKARG